MGKERGKKGKHIFLHSACILIILLLSAGCAVTLELHKRWQGHRHFDLAQKLISKGDYEGALKEDEEVLRLLPVVSPGDQALFHMGLIWAHPENPRKDYKRSLECFHRIVRDFPDSALIGEVIVWAGTINDLISHENSIKDLEETLGELINKDKDLEKTASVLKKRIQDLEGTASALKKQLNALKEIDIGIEEKKREDLPKE
jgi:tetratricopeptide (TPR) repeat protein